MATIMVIPIQVVGHAHFNIFTFNISFHIYLRVPGDEFLIDELQIPVPFPSPIVAFAGSTRDLARNQIFEFPPNFALVGARIRTLTVNGSPVTPDPFEAPNNMRHNIYVVSAGAEVDNTPPNILSYGAGAEGRLTFMIHNTQFTTDNQVYQIRPNNAWAAVINDAQG